jgi:phage shock protein PspC (stress-responsive transcriptional regulator)
MESTAETQPRKLRRSKSNRLLAGVCGGLGEYFGLSATIYRIAFVALSFAGGTGILIYLAAALVIPAEGSDESILAEALRQHRERPWLVIGLALIALGIFFWISGPHHGGFWRTDGWLWIAVGAVVVWAQQRSRGEREKARWAPWRVAAGVVILIAVGLLAVLDLTSTLEIRWWVVFGVGVVLLGVLALGAAGRGLGGVALALAVAVVAVVVVVGFAFEGGVGDRSYQPASAAELKRYELGIGHLIVDLHDVSLPPGDTLLRAHVGVGRLELWVPEGVPVKVDGKVKVGNADVLGRHEDGTEIHEQLSAPGAPAASSRLVIDAKVGIGDLNVHRGAP